MCKFAARKYTPGSAFVYVAPLYCTMPRLVRACADAVADATGALAGLIQRIRGYAQKFEMNEIVCKSGHAKTCCGPWFCLSICTRARRRYDMCSLVRVFGVADWEQVRAVVFCVNVSLNKYYSAFLVCTAHFVCSPSHKTIIAARGRRFRSQKSEA